MLSLATACDKFAFKSAKQKKKGKKKKMFKIIIKDKGITCTPMTILKNITYVMKVLHTQQ
jgi:hypothetical protein